MTNYINNALNQDNKTLINKADLALIILDMQQDFMKYLTKSDRNMILSSTLNMLDFGIKNDIPIVLFEYFGHKNTIDEVFEKLRNYNNLQRYIKIEDNGFQYTAIANRMHQENIKKLFFIGINATSCVLRSMRGARANRLEIMTADDVIANGTQIYNGDRNNIRELFNKSKIKYYDSHKEFLDILN